MVLSLFLLFPFLFVTLAANCQTFQGGLCPGPADCMCTLGSGCNVALTEAEKDILRTGGCGGQCRTVAHGQCPGGSNCLANVGGCGGGGGGCLSPRGSPCACCGRPADGLYFLTSFDGTSCSCGPCHSHGPYFAADRQRFGCFANLNVCRGGKCVKLAVTDYGPSCFVENDAGGPVLDASPSVCQALTGGSSCGWSDHYSVTVSVALDNRPYGPFTVTPEEFTNMTRYSEKYEFRVLREKGDEEVSASVDYHKIEH